MWRFFWLAVLLSMPQALLAQPAQQATAPSTARATQTTAASTGTNSPPGDSKSSSTLHWVAENLKDLGFIIGGVVAVILAIVAAVLFTKRGRLMILGTVLDGLASDPASAKRLYNVIMLSELADKDRASNIYDLVIRVDEDRGKIYDRVLKVDEDGGKIYDRVLKIEEERGKIAKAFLNRLSEPKDSAALLLMNVIVWGFGKDRLDDFIGLLANPKTVKALQDLLAVQKDDK